MIAKIASVAVENAIYHFDRAFSYRIPEGMPVQPGCRVSVPFGRGNAKRQGIVLAVREDEGEELKAVCELLDTEPVLNDEMLRMCGFMKRHCFCTYYDAVKAMLPAGINYRLSQEYSVSQNSATASLTCPMNSAGSLRLFVQRIIKRRNTLFCMSLDFPTHRFSTRWRLTAFCIRTTRLFAVSVTKRSR